MICACGCGLPTPIATKTDRSSNRIKGQHMRYIRGHNASRPFANRLWLNIDQLGGPEACWPWLGKQRYGYGQIWASGRLVLAHRLVWELTLGPIQPGLCVLHRCDNPPCCNPAHLFLGTKADNVADMMAKGRHAAGPSWRAAVSRGRRAALAERRSA